MKTIKIILILLICVSFTNLYSQGNEDSFELGAAIYRQLNTAGGIYGQHWHTGVFEYFEYSSGTGIMRSTEAAGWWGSTRNRDASSTIGISIDNLATLKSEFKTAFIADYPPYHGAFSTNNITPTTASGISATAKQLRDALISWTWVDMLDAEDRAIPQFPYWGEDWNGTIGDISDIRCDGVVEYSYEKNGVLVSNNNNISTSGNSHLDAHNDWHDYEDTFQSGELCPKIQAGENHGGSGTNCSTFNPLITAPPASSDFLTKQFPEYTQLNFKISDNASVKAYVMLQVKKPSEQTWHLLVDENNNLWKFRAVDLTEWNGTTQGDNFYVPWNYKYDDGTYTNGTDNYQLKVTVIDQGANYTENSYDFITNATSTLNNSQFPEGNGSGGTYEVNGINKGISWNGPIFINQSIKAIPPNSNWSFYNWSDGVLSNPRTYSEPVIVYAKYKGVGISSFVEALSGSNQRKVVRTADGGIHKVYESFGHVWYEYSFDEGNTWLFGNNGKPLDSFTGKSPTISSYGNDIGIVFQQQFYVNNLVKLVWFLSANPTITKMDSYCRDLIYTDIPYSSNLQLVLSLNSIGPRYLCVWKESDGLYFIDGYYSQSMPLIGPYKIAISNSSSLNPSIAVNPPGYDDGYYVVWEENNNIYQTYGNSTQLTYSSLSKNNLSTGSGYTYNYKPSITNYGTSNAITAWIGKRYEEDEEQQLEKSQTAPGHWVYRAICKNLNIPNTFDVYGDNGVASVNVNNNSDGTYAVAWSTSSGEAKYWSNTGGLGEFRSGGNILNGIDVQLSNGTSFADMKGLMLDAQMAPPYQLRISNNNLSEIQKQQFKAVGNGREGIVRDSATQFYFALGDITVDGTSIEFDVIPDSINECTISFINENIITKPILLTDNSTFQYSAQYGCTDSVITPELWKNGKSINFKVQLIDDQSKSVLGEYDNITFSENTYNRFENIGYEINTHGIGNKTVRLRLMVNTDLDAKYSLSNRNNNEPVISLGKNGSRRTKTGFKGSLEIKEYNLSQNYPNPFNPATTISYALPKEGNVVLKVYDALGREVVTLVNNHQEAGSYNVQFDASKLSSGMYVYKLSSDKFTSVKKMMLVK